MKQPPLPGVAERVEAGRVLLLAPHADDEVLGPGGLVAALARGGAAVHVLFLTDSGGVEGEPAARAERAAQRREEARAAGAVLGVAEIAGLAIPDGSLAQRRAEAAAAIRARLERLRPDLVLVPSPLERSADHRAAFAALHEALAPLRDGDPLLRALEASTVLVYEVNHPAFPDLLVDVSAEVPTIEAAMRCHASQEARHPYLAAALGLRRFRCLSLPAGVQAAEGYRRLSIDDFRTRGRAALINVLGGPLEAAAGTAAAEAADGPLVSVVVRTRDRPQLLAEALASLARSDYRRLEVVLVNDGGATPAVGDDYPLPLVRVELPASRGRAGAANAGVAAASGSYIAFLDDDDLVEPQHYATLVGALAAAGVRVPYSDAAVAVYELEPAGGRWECRERRLPYSRDFDADLLLLDNFIPFHTVLLPRDLLGEIGPLDESLPFFEDWDLLLRLSRRTAFHHLATVTCEYRVFRGAAHHVFGERPSERGDFLAVKARVLEKHRAALTPEGLARAVDRLRGEAVTLGEESRRQREELRQVATAREGDRVELARLHGEEQRLAADLARLDGAVRTLQAEAHEARLVRDTTSQELGAERERHRAAVAELSQALARQGDELRATYAEIVRLGGIVAAMENTRAWRLHRAVERARGRTPQGA